LCSPAKKSKIGKEETTTGSTPEGKESGTSPLGGGGKSRKKGKGVAPYLTLSAGKRGQVHPLLKELLIRRGGAYYWGKEGGRAARLSFPLVSKKRKTTLEKKGSLPKRKKIAFPRGEGGKKKTTSKRRKNWETRGPTAANDRPKENFQKVPLNATARRKKGGVQKKGNTAQTEKTGFLGCLSAKKKKKRAQEENPRKKKKTRRPRIPRRRLLKKERDRRGKKKGSESSRKKGL